MCREDGGPVATNRVIRDLDLAMPSAGDSRRIQIVVDGLGLFGGSQLANDATVVGPVGADGLFREGFAAKRGTGPTTKGTRWLKHAPEHCLRWCPWCSFTECKGQVEWAEMNSKGRWRELLDAAVKVEVPASGEREVLTEDQQRGRGAQDRGQRGQVSEFARKWLGLLWHPRQRIL